MTFLDKYDLVKKSVPTPAANNRSPIDCEYVDNVFRSKGCYFCFDCNLLEDSLYTRVGRGKRLVDCDTVIESEKCYYCVDSNNCFGSSYLIDCNNNTDCHFSAFLNSCTDCFGCVSLTHKKYCIFNKQYTKEEYFKRIEELKKENPGKILKQMLELKQKIPHSASHQFNAENSPFGDYIYYAKNCYWAFMANYSENSGYLYEAGRMKNCWDAFFSGGDFSKKTLSEQCYEIAYTDYSYGCAFLNNCENCTNCYYSERLLNCTDCFGCVGLTNKRYCILNNQLTKDQYEKAVKEVKKELGWKV